MQVVNIRAVVGTALLILNKPTVSAAITADNNNNAIKTHAGKQNGDLKKLPIRLLLKEYIYLIIKYNILRTKQTCIVWNF